MSSKKQQRRRSKSQRHEYETVYVDEEGNVLDPEEAEALAPAAPGKRDPRAKAGTTRATRVVEPPSWRRALRRAALMAPLMFIVIMLLEKNSAVGARLMIAVFYSILFVPFMYLMDSVAYRTYRKRLERLDAS